MMIATFLIVCLVASTNAAISGPDCVEKNSAMVTSVMTPGYIKQVNKILNCDQPKFYTDCYKLSGKTWPRDLDSVIKMSCDLPDSISDAQFNACLKQSKEFVTIAAFKPFTYFSCPVTILRSEEEGFLCAEYKRLGADVASKIPLIVDQSLASASQSFESTAPPDMKACAKLIPKTALEAIDLICNKLAAGTEETKCLEKLGYSPNRVGLPKPGEPGYVGNSLRSVGSIGGICFALLFNILLSQNYS